MKRKRAISLFSILISWVIIIILVTAFVITGVCFSHIISINKKNALDKYQQSFYQTHQLLDDELRKMATTAATLSSDNNIFAAINLSQSSEASRKITGQASMQAALSKAIQYNSSIRDIVIYSKDHMQRYDNVSGYSKVYNETIPNESWFKSLQDGEYNQIFIPEYPINSTLNYYLFAVSMSSKTQNNEYPKRVLIVMMNNKIIHDIVKNSDIMDSSIVCLLDSNGELLYANRSADIVDSFDKNSLISFNSGSEYKIDNENYYIINNSSSYSGLHLVSLIRTNDLLSGTDRIQPILSMALLLISALSVIIFILVFRTMMRPLKMLTQAMDNTSVLESNHETFNSRYLEIQKISVAFTLMNKRISQYIIDLQKQEEQRRIAELKTLEAQINPHFIYNTLDAIKWVAIINKAEAVAQMISSFSRLLQLSLSAGKDKVPLSQEIAHVKHYIELMEYRYNHQISVTYSMEESTLQILSLKLIIQPFVENCLIHAFETTAENKHICLSSKIEMLNDEHILLIEISDNGCGLDVNEIKISDSSLSGIGIHNVDERIKLCYGKRYGVEIKNAPAGGTIVKIRQPIERSEVNYFDFSNNS